LPTLLRKLPNSFSLFFCAASRITRQGALHQNCFPLPA
jgi:hypothetical protein